VYRIQNTKTIYLNKHDSTRFVYRIQNTETIYLNKHDSTNCIAAVSENNWKRKTKIKIEYLGF